MDHNKDTQRDRNLIYIDLSRFVDIFTIIKLFTYYIVGFYFFFTWRNNYVMSHKVTEIGIW